MNKKLKRSPYGGYPNDGIKSRELFPNRIHTDIEDGKAFLSINHEHYPQFLTCDTPEKLNDFYIDRIHDLTRALHIAEVQITDMHADQPFIPEDFKFTPHITFGDHKIQAYQKNNWAMIRGKGTRWIISNKNTDSPIVIDLPSSQIAFIVLRAIGVISDEDFEEVEPIHLKITDADVKPEGMSEEEWIQVQFQRGKVTATTEEISKTEK